MWVRWGILKPLVFADLMLAIITEPALKGSHDELERPKCDSTRDSCAMRKENRESLRGPSSRLTVADHLRRESRERSELFNALREAIKRAIACTERGIGVGGLTRRWTGNKTIKRERNLFKLQALNSYWNDKLGLRDCFSFFLLALKSKSVFVSWRVVEKLLELSGYQRAKVPSPNRSEAFHQLQLMKSKFTDPTGGEFRALSTSWQIMKRSPRVVKADPPPVIAQSVLLMD
jgi:hypothetical protein